MSAHFSCSDSWRLYWGLGFLKQVKPSLGCFPVCVGVYLFVLSFYLIAFFISVDIVSSATWLLEDEVQNGYY